MTPVPFSSPSSPFLRRPLFFAVPFSSPLRSPDLVSLAFGSADVVGPDEQIFVLDGFTVTSERTTDFNNPSDPNPIERTVGNYTFAEYYQTGTIGGHSDRTIVEYCARHRVDQLSNIALTISGQLAE